METEKLTKSQKNKIYQKEYYKNNKDKLSMSAKETIQCELCGSVITKYRMFYHLKTKLCQSRQVNNKIIEERKQQL